MFDPDNHEANLVWRSGEIIDKDKEEVGKAENENYEAENNTTSRERNPLDIIETERGNHRVNVVERKVEIIDKKRDRKQVDRGSITSSPRHGRAPPPLPDKELSKALASPAIFTRSKTPPPLPPRK